MFVNIKDNIYLTWNDTDNSNFNSYQTYYFPFILYSYGCALKFRFFKYLLF